MQIGIGSFYVTRASVLKALAPVLLVVLTGCGGGGGDGDRPAVVNPPIIGTNGGTVTDVSGAAVIVPAGAITADTTIRVAMDSTGAPALPQGLATAGNMYVITPHGGDFAEPVEVRIPAPSVTLQPNQEFKLAKAQPGGEWVVLDDTEFSSGMLSAKVSSFSYFMGMIVSYPLPILQFEPMKISTSLDCGSQSCTSAAGDPVTATFTVTTNNGQMPQPCVNPKLFIMADGSYNFLLRGSDLTEIPLGGGSRTYSISYFPNRGLLHLDVVKSCDGLPSFFSNSLRKIVHRAPIPGYPNLSVVNVPLQLDVVAGVDSNLDAILGGGAWRDAWLGLIVPTAQDRAVIDWQRSDDNGASWRVVARSYQNEGNSLPRGGGTAWFFWSVRHGFIATAMDQGALLRVHACYTPPTGTVPPCVTGPATRVNVLQQSALPAIADAPRSQLITTGQTANLSVTATGLPAPTLQWQWRAANSNGAWINVGAGSGATTANYTTSPLTLIDNGMQYRVVATSSLGSVSSAIASISVSDLDVAPTITSQPGNLSVASGSDAVFAVVARGTEALSYQWRFNGVAIAGANSAVLRLPAVNGTSAGSYSVTVGNDAGDADSNAATLTVTPGTPGAVAPTIITQPAAVTANASNTATFAVGVDGSGPFTFQWRKDSVAITGATSAVLTLNSISTTDAGNYSVIVRNAVNTTGVTSSGATLTVNANPAVIAPAIVTQPATLVIASGGSSILAVAATGSGSLTYQWAFNGTPISGATSAVLNLSSVGMTNVGSYTVTVSNGVSSITSQAANVILLGAPTITQQPVAATAAQGATAAFTVTASGSDLRYQWLRNGVSIANATQASYTTPTLSGTDSGVVYSVIVYNGAGLLFSQGAVLTVQASTVLTMTSITPASNATNVSRTVSPALSFSTALNATTLTPSNITLTSAGSNVSVVSAITAGSTANAFNVVTAANLLPATQYTLTVTSGVRGQLGESLANPVTSQFTTDDGAWGTAGLIETDNADATYDPQIAVSANGDAFAVWARHDGVRQNIWSNRYTAGGGWGTATLIETDNAGGAFKPQIAVDANGNALTVWYQSDGARNNIWSNRYTVGSGWGTATMLETDIPGDAHSPAIAMDASGNALAVWEQFDGVRSNIWSNRYTPINGWDTAWLIETSNVSSAGGSKIAMNASGNAVAVWIQSDGTRWSIWSNRYTAGVGWGAATLIENDNAEDVGIPEIAMDASGNAVAVWIQRDGTRDDIWSNRYTAGIGWGTAALLELDNAETAEYPQIAVDGNGNAVAVWQQRDSTRYNIWSNRYVAGSGWGTAALLELDNAGTARNPQIAMDASGNALAVWQQYDGMGNNIVSNRYSAGSGWGVAALIETDNAGSADVPQIAMDASGNALAVWIQSDGTGRNTVSNRFE